MKLTEFVEYLVNPSKLKSWYIRQNIDENSESLAIYMKGSLNIESDIYIFDFDETEGNIEIQKDGIKYIAMLSIYMAQDFIESDILPQKEGLINKDIANRLLAYAIYDA